MGIRKFSYISAILVLFVLFTYPVTAHFTTDDFDPNFYTTLHFTPQDPPIAGEQTDMYLSIYNATSGEPITNLDVVHERIVHVFVVSQDMEVFAHIHPEDRVNGTELASQGIYIINYTFPKDGYYAVITDFTYGGINVIKKFQLYVIKDAASSQVNDTKKASVDLDRTKIFGEYEVTLNAPEKIEAGSESELDFHIEKNGEPVRDLQDYLGSEIHVLVIRDDLKFVGHTHTYRPGHNLHLMKMSQVYYGPDLPVRYTFQYPGTYTIFAQFMHNGKVVTTRFFVKVDDNLYNQIWTYGSFSFIAGFALFLFRREIAGLLKHKKNI
jgi:hypothetical protein